MLIRDLKSQQIPIPNEDGQWMQFRRLNGRRLQDAIDAKILQHQQRLVARLKAIGSEGAALKAEADQRETTRQMEALEKVKAALGPDAMKVLTEAAGQALTPAATAAAAPDPMARYDRDTLLRAGICAWSYDRSVAEVFADAEDGLDEATADWAARELLRFNGLLPEAAEADLKN